MNEPSLDHVGIAVSSIDEALPTWEFTTGSSGTGRERVESQGVEVVFIGTGPTSIELIAPTRADSPVAKFLERRGPGLHHVCYRVPDIRAALASYEERGLQLIDREPRAGAHNHLVAFLHPRSTGGVLIELLQAAP
ncbi:MAG TPA: methylmalonyl-CoA epimerase [Longimicrobiaceae bacterium]|nr:methylmalonyl-CoA epimerase [Longimicrobiaceae bacterium]